MQAFFQEPYMQEHPEDAGNIEKLKDLIAWQVPGAVSLWQGQLPPVSTVPPHPREPHGSLFSHRSRCWQRASGSTGRR